MPQSIVFATRYLAWPSWSRAEVFGLSCVALPQRSLEVVHLTGQDLNQALSDSRHTRKLQVFSCSDKTALDSKIFFVDVSPALGGMHMFQGANMACSAARTL